MSTHYNIAKHSGVRTSSGGGGGGGGTAVGKSVYFTTDYQNWTIVNGYLSQYNWMEYNLGIVENMGIAVTTDGNEPQEDLSNVLFGSGDEINSEIRIVFKIEVNGVVYNASLNIAPIS